MLLVSVSARRQRKSALTPTNVFKTRDNDLLFKSKIFFFDVTFAMANCQYRLSSSKFLELNSHEPWRGVAVKSSALANAARNKFFFD